jgi:hypothetical protein
MQPKDPDISHAQILELFHYDLESGKLTWRVDPGNGSHAGDEAGWTEPKSGYRRVGILGRRVMVHRVIVFYITGAWPQKRVDHRDTVKNNNTWLNIRDASNSQNGANIKRRSDNTSGFKGVTWHEPTGKWHARICLGGKSKSLGLYGSPETAHEAYKVAAVDKFGEFARAH